MKELQMTNGDVEDAQAHVCHNCQTPLGDNPKQSVSGEWYHPDCLPGYERASGAL